MIRDDEATRDSSNLLSDVSKYRIFIKQIFEFRESTGVLRELTANYYSSPLPFMCRIRSVIILKYRKQNYNFFGKLSISKLQELFVDSEFSK